MSLITFEKRLFAGIDIGQVNDWTALSVIERVRAVPRTGLHFGLIDQAEEDAKRTPMRLDLVHLDRIPLGTLYPKQVEIIATLLRQPILSGVTSYVDLTGVGRGPFDMLKATGVRNLHGIMITGARGEATQQPYGWSVGKAQLINPLQIEMQNDRLSFADGLELADTLERELMNFRASINTNGNMTFNAREGENDDLTLATSYALFGALRPTPVHSLDVRFPA